MPERPDLLRRASAEAIAAFALVFCVGGAAAAEASHHAQLGLPAQAVVSGLAIMALVYAVGHLSGARDHGRGSSIARRSIRRWG